MSAKYSTQQTQKVGPSGDLQGIVTDPDNQTNDQKKDSFVLGLIDQNGKKIQRMSTSTATKNRKV